METGRIRISLQQEKHSQAMLQSKKINHSFAAGKSNYYRKVKVKMFVPPK